MLYENTIYPLQDKVLAALDSAKTKFYLTGGTALSRCYFHHRYSDDLDFFVNDDSQFGAYMNAIFSAMHRAGIAMQLEIDEPHFKRIVANQILKIDFVNDIPFYLGTPQQVADFPFPAIDNLQNILANKLTALRDRTEIKDLVDIREIAMRTDPDWKMIFSAADSKAAGIFPPQIAEKMDRFDLANLERISWISQPDSLQFKQDIQQIIAAMLALP